MNKKINELLSVCWYFFRNWYIFPNWCIFNMIQKSTYSHFEMLFIRSFKSNCFNWNERRTERISFFFFFWVFDFAANKKSPIPKYIHSYMNYFLLFFFVLISEQRIKFHIKIFTTLCRKKINNQIIAVFKKK